MRSWSPAAVFGVLLALAVVAYWPVLQCGFVWDDDDYVTANPLLRDWHGLWRIWTEPRSLPQYYPLVHTTFWLEYRLWGLHPVGYHVVNVSLHVLGAWLLWRFVRALAVPGALFAAAWFVVHPVHVESVAWVTERKNVLSLVCALLAARRWLAWHDGGRPRELTIASAWFAAALLAKTVVATLPAALLVVVWWRDGRIGARAWRGAVPWLAAGAVMGALTAWLEATHVGAAATPWQLHGAERVLVAGRAPWFYLGSLLWPVGTCFNYPRWQLDGAAVAQWAWPAASAAAIAAAFVLRARIGRGPLAVLLLFGGMLLPALGFVDVYPFRYSYVADHFQYHASTAVLVGIGALAAGRAAGRVPAAARLTAGAAVIAACAVLTLLAIPRYRDFESLMRATLAQNPDSSLALTNLGAMANFAGDGARAKALLERALAVDPANDDAMVGLGAIAHRAGDRAAARRWCERALELQPGDVGANRNLAVMHLEDGHAAQALPHAERAVATVVAMDEPVVDAHATLAWALHDLQQWQRALDVCDYVLQRTEDVATRERAATCLLRLGRYPQAAGNALVVLRSRPASVAARAAYVEAAEPLLRPLAPAAARDALVADCRKHGVDPAPLLAQLAAALRARGEAGRADTISGR